MLQSVKFMLHTQQIFVSSKLDIFCFACYTYLLQVNATARKKHFTLAKILHDGGKRICFQITKSRKDNSS